ncbi:hypothetical protein [Bradyrhizobium sp. SZCCHNR1039]|uniref:hypothetical protein n=1 Tax=Bradyrhizobium sp. SZCCHNR1039 TaxID=3057350 RepID=UPI002916AFE4|nr:hypothetical protein [Bradyrhizobium sp. SZCCHNR1039]
MSKDRLFIVPEAERPSWLQYPRSYRRLVAQGLVDLSPWHVMECQRVITHFRGLAQRYPKRELFPFAYRQDDDDVACWARSLGEKVVVIHNFASRGWEDEATFDNVWS